MDRYRNLKQHHQNERRVKKREEILKRKRKTEGMLAVHQNDCAKKLSVQHAA